MIFAVFQLMGMVLEFIMLLKSFVRMDMEKYERCFK